MSRVKGSRSADFLTFKNDPGIVRDMVRGDLAAAAKGFVTGSRRRR